MSTDHPRGHILSLPPELLSMIFSHLRRLAQPTLATDRRTLPLAAYAAVCRQWQPVVESFTFQYLRNVPSTELHTLDRIFSRGNRHRRDALRSLSMVTILPGYSTRDRRRFERAKDRAANDAALTDAVRRILEILAAWDQDCSAQDSAGLPALSLILDGARAPMDRYRWEQPEGEPRDYEADDFGEHRYRRSYLRLVGLDQNPLPTVPRVTNFSAEFFMRRMEGASAVAIAKCFPRLQKLDLALNDNEWRYPAVRQQQRYDFAQALTSLHLSGPALTEFSLEFTMETPTDHGYPVPSALHPSSPTTDHLCLTLNALSQLPTLKSFAVGHYNDFVLSPSLFWPDKDVSTIKPDSPFWPSLEYIEVVAHCCTPTGGWYYERDPSATPTTPSDDDDVDGDDYDSSPSDGDSDSSQPDHLNSHREARLKGQARDDQFRTMLSPATFNSLARSFARAVTRMPKLHNFQFKIASTGYGRLEAEWVRAGLPCAEYDNYEPGDEAKNRWMISVQEDARWEIPDSLMEILREGVGKDGVIRVQTTDY
ncbi:hypothetical protein BDZ91DRAFT_785930 [Kalaharituber pfeilii]|nr:hypothetical protein BDZ91DRAFT_785930 [Kalaharituber pfeilii]